MKSIVSKKVAMSVKIACSFLVACSLTSEWLCAQMVGGGISTGYYVFAKNLMVKPVLPLGAPTNPPNPQNHPPVEMDVKVQYEVFQTYCDIEEFGVRDLTPTRTFRGKIGVGANWLETAPAQDVTTLPFDVPVNMHTDTVALNKSPMKLYSKKATDTAGWTEDHNFVSDMSGGPMVTMNPVAVIDVPVDDISGLVERVEYRIQVGLQTPAPEYLASDQSAGYEYDQQYKYLVYASSGLAGGPFYQATVAVPQYWRRGATYVEVRYERAWFGNPAATGAASFFVHRRSKTSGGDWNQNDPLTDAGVNSSVSAAFSSLCFATSD